MARHEGSRVTRIFVGILLVLGFLGYLLWALQNEETFRVVRKQLEHTAAGFVVSGEVYNASAASTPLNVEVAFFDEQGRELVKETVTLNNLDAGASATFRTQPQQLSHVKDYTIYLNTGRNMYGN
jgi:hypothetical protein